MNSVVKTVLKILTHLFLFWLILKFVLKGAFGDGGGNYSLELFSWWQIVISVFIAIGIWYFVYRLIENYGHKLSSEPKPIDEKREQTEDETQQDSNK
jgi:phosphate/sulfate permease